MKKPTFNAMLPKVGLTLGLAALAFTVGFTLIFNITAKSMSDSEYKILAKNIEAKLSATKIRCDSVSDMAFDKCLTEAESIREGSKLALDARRKIIVSGQPTSNVASAETLSNKKPININSMPVIDKLNPIFKQLRLI